MSRIVLAAVAVALVAAVPGLAAEPYAIKVSKAEPPKGLNPAVSKELGPEAVELQENGQPVCTIWVCKQVPTFANENQAKNGLGYRELKEGTLLGAIQIVKTGWTDYRKQKIKPGVYTLRLGFQPQDGDHMGTAPYNEFVLLSPAADDKDPAPLGEHKKVVELSNKTTGAGHPAVMLVFPGKPASPPTLAKAPGQEGHWVLNWKTEATVGGKAYPVPVVLVVVGQTSA